MLDRYLNEELPRNMSEGQKEMIDLLMTEKLKEEVSSEEFIRNLQDMATSEYGSPLRRDYKNRIGGRKECKDASKKKKSKARQQKASRKQNKRR